MGDGTWTRYIFGAFTEGMSRAFFFGTGVAWSAKLYHFDVATRTGEDAGCDRVSFHDAAPWDMKVRGEYLRRPGTELVGADGSYPVQAGLAHP